MLKVDLDIQRKKFAAVAQFDPCCCKCRKNSRLFTLSQVPLYNHLEQLVAPLLC